MLQYDAQYYYSPAPEYDMRSGGKWSNWVFSDCWNILLLCISNVECIIIILLQLTLGHVILFYLQNISTATVKKLVLYFQLPYWPNLWLLRWHILSTVVSWCAGMQVSFLAVCLCVCACVLVCICLSAQNLENCWSEIDVTWCLLGKWAMVNAKSGRKLVTFDLDL